MANDLDGHLVTLPRKNLDQFRRMARKSGKVPVSFSTIFELAANGA